MPSSRRRDVSDEQILAQYAACHSIQKTAKALGLGDTTVHRVLKRHNVARVGLQEYRQSLGGPKTEPYIGIYRGSTEEILKLYNAGLSMRKIADHIGRSVHVVQRRIKVAGVAKPWQGAGPEHSMWTGGRTMTVQGYWRQWIDDNDPMASMRNAHGTVLEHRLVMARKLGRPLLRTEQVHHVDGNRENNNPENIELRQGSHGAGVVMLCMECGSYNVGHTFLGEAVKAIRPKYRR